MWKWNGMNLCVIKYECYRKRNRVIYTSLMFMSTKLTCAMQPAISHSAEVYSEEPWIANCKTNTSAIKGIQDRLLQRKLVKQIKYMCKVVEKAVSAFHSLSQLWESPYPCKVSICETQKCLHIVWSPPGVAGHYSFKARSYLKRLHSCLCRGASISVGIQRVFVA